MLHCFAFFCVWNNSANASERQMQKISVYVMVHVSGGGGGGGGGLSSGLSQSGEKAVEQSGGAGSDAPVPSS